MTELYVLFNITVTFGFYQCVRVVNNPQATAQDKRYLENSVPREDKV